MSQEASPNLNSRYVLALSVLLRRGFSPELRDQALTLDVFRDGDAQDLGHCRRHVNGSNPPFDPLRRDPAKKEDDRYVSVIAVR